MTSLVKSVNGFCDVTRPDDGLECDLPREPWLCHEAQNWIRSVLAARVVTPPDLLLLLLVDMVGLPFETCSQMLGRDTGHLVRVARNTRRRLARRSANPLRDDEEPARSSRKQPPATADQRQLALPLT